MYRNHLQTSPVSHNRFIAPKICPNFAAFVFLCVCIVTINLAAIIKEPVVTSSSRNTSDGVGIANATIGRPFRQQYKLRSHLDVLPTIEETPMAPFGISVGNKSHDHNFQLPSELSVRAYHSAMHRSDESNLYFYMNSSKAASIAGLQKDQGLEGNTLTHAESLTSMDSHLEEDTSSFEATPGIPDSDSTVVLSTNDSDVSETPAYKIIYIHGLFERSGQDCRSQIESGPFEFRAAQLAIQHVNDRGVIPGYRLEMYENDTQCDSGVAVDSFFHSLYRQPTMMMVLGTGSSEVTERLARVVNRWNIIQVSYGAASPALSDQKNFPLFYRTVAPESSNNAALLSFIQHFRWDAVAAIHEQGDRHALPINKLVTEMEQANISVTFTKGVSDRDYKEHLRDLKEMDCRIIVGSFSHALLKKLFCQVHHLRMFGAEYAWILQGQVEDQEPWWQDAITGTDCTQSQLLKSVEGLITVGSYYGIVGNATSISNETSESILEAISYNTVPGASGFVMQAYDAVWLIALALKRAQETWNTSGNALHLEEFSYSNYEMAQNLSEILGNLQFLGVSGPVSFHKSDRVGITAFQQNQGGVQNLVSLYHPDANELDFDCHGCKTLLWQGDSVPIARRIIKLRVAILERTVFVCVTTLAVCGVAMAITFLSFNLYYRRSKFIKLSSPNLNNFVVVGCVLVYVAVILLGIDHGALASDDHFPFICSARAFLLSGGFSLAFGCMFIKTYRVYHIFIRTNTGIVKSKLLHDQQLLGMVSVLVLIDCALVTLWVTVDPMERQLRNLTMQVNVAEMNVVYLDQREQCNSLHMAKWLGTLYIYKGLLLVVGCYMAWETRHVKIPALNDSQYIGMSVYNVVITSVIVVALANVIPVEQYTLTFILVSTLIFVSTTTTLCLLFIPKIHTILMNPEDATVVATPGVKVECKTRRFVIDEPRESLYRAEVLNRVLKRELQALEEEIARLTGKFDGKSCKGQQESKKIRLYNPDNNDEDEDSDDGLPPWFADYKEYSSTGSDGAWYPGTQQPAVAAGSSLCASALSALRPMVVSTEDNPGSSSYFGAPALGTKAQDFCKKTEPRGSKTGRASAMRSSLPAMMMMMLDCGPKRNQPGSTLPPVRTYLSDRDLKMFENSPPRTGLCKQKQHAKSSPRILEGLSLDQHSLISHKQPGSEPRLSTLHCSHVREPPKAPRSVSSAEGGFSVVSENTASGESTWVTAPLYCSTSFSTPMEEPSLDNKDSRTLSKTPTPTLDDLPSSSAEQAVFSGSEDDPPSLENGSNGPCETASSPCDTVKANTAQTKPSPIPNTDNSNTCHFPHSYPSDLDNAVSRVVSPNGNTPMTPLKCQSRDDSANNNVNNKSNHSINVTNAQRQRILESSKDGETESRTRHDGGHCPLTSSVTPSALPPPDYDVTPTSANHNPPSTRNRENKTEVPPPQGGAGDSTPDNQQNQIDDIRNKIFRLERDLILLEIDRSESVDL